MTAQDYMAPESVGRLQQRAGNASWLRRHHQRRGELYE